HNLFCALHKHYSVDELTSFFNSLNKNQCNKIFYSIGILSNDIENFNKVYNALSENFKPQNVLIDCANAYTQSFVDFVKRFTEKYPSINVMAGNVVTGEITEELLLAGCSAIRVRIRGGSV